MRDFLFNKRPSVLETVCTTSTALNPYLSMIGARFFHEVVEPKELKHFTMTEDNQAGFISKVKKVAEGIAGHRNFTSEQARAAFYITSSYFMILNGCKEHRLYKCYLHFLACQMGTIAYSLKDEIHNPIVKNEIQDLRSALFVKSGVYDGFIEPGEPGATVGKIGFRATKNGCCKYCEAASVPYNMENNRDLNVGIKVQEFSPVYLRGRDEIGFDNIRDKAIFHFCSYAHIVQLLEDSRNIFVDFPYFRAGVVDSVTGYISGESTIFEVTKRVLDSN